LLLGVDPFLQAIIIYEGSRDATQSYSNPSGTVSNMIDVGFYQQYSMGVPTVVGLGQGGGLTVSAFRSQPHMGIASAMYSGFLNDSRTVKTKPSFSCPTGNCTLAPYTTLAVCSQCSDVTSHLVKTSRFGANLATITSATAMLSEVTVAYTLPCSKTSLANLAHGEPRFTAYMTAKAVASPGHTQSFGHLRTLLAAVDVIRAEKGYTEQNLSWNQTKVAATECALDLCANAYKGQVVRGKFDERFLGS
jgi:hypothetical protein